MVLDFLNNREIVREGCEDYINYTEDTFYDWFRGFCDAEGNFIIRVRKIKNKLSGFEFIFRISLHIDDLKVLDYIKKKLKSGKIRRDRNTYVLIFSSLNDIETIIIPLFEKYPLMTKKYLDYIDFRNSFNLFKKRQLDKQNREDYNLKILNLKWGMNDKRINFSLPENHVKITSNYLLGYIEGDGSFYFNKIDNTVHISLVTIKNDRILLEKIKEFLFNQLDKNSLFLAKNTKLIHINNKSIYKNRKVITILEISQIDYICNYLIPYFDNLFFRTKKYLDYLDFKRIAYLIFNGKHLTEKGKSIIVKLADTMNNSRLSTNSKKPLSLIENSDLQSELESLEKSEPLISMDSEGRALWISKNRWIRTTLIIEAILSNGETKYFSSGVSCAAAFCVSNTTISNRLDDKKSLKSKENKILAITLKRIKVYMKV